MSTVSPVISVVLCRWFHCDPSADQQPLPEGRCVGVVRFVLLCSSSSVDQIYVFEGVLHSRIYDEPFAKTRLKIGPPVICLWLLKVRIEIRTSRDLVMVVGSASCLLIRVY